MSFSIWILSKKNGVRQIEVKIYSAGAHQERLEDQVTPLIKQDRSFRGQGEERCMCTCESSPA